MARDRYSKVQDCPTCGAPPVKFSNYGYCKPCKSVYDRERKVRLLKEYKRYLSDKGCSACKESHPDCLEVHHLFKGAKRFKGSRSQSNMYNKQDIDKGVGIVLCANCHLHFHSYFGGRHADFPPQTEQTTVECINLNKSRRI